MSTGPAARPIILLIDDEADVRLPLRLSLERYGYRVMEARDGEEGLELVGRRGDEIALVLVDHHMPRMAGAAVVRQLRRGPHRFAIILMSGLTRVETGVGESEPDAFLRKPFELTELTHTVRRLVGEGRPGYGVNR